MIPLQGKYTKAKVWIDNIDATTMSQIYEMINRQLPQPQGYEACN